MEVMWVSTPTAGGEERGPVLIEANVSGHPASLTLPLPLPLTLPLALPR